ncbi:MAG TPA: glycerol-3-phosphate acyltransferase, partial [Chloroflexi bacterium]|nr:glycerol-3-phosphate acyltransferase [Chloroflexota bacterium]
MQALQLLPVVVAGYLLGSIPTGVLLARLFGWPDPRTHGSGHIGGLNSLRGGGLVAGVLVALGDLAKGFAAVWLAEHLSPGPWAIPLGGVAAVIGHNWPVWLGFSGGMGLATAGGAVAERNPLL